VYDTAHKKTVLKLPGNATSNDACELYRSKWHLPAWGVITITRPDGTPFWVEDKGDYAASVRYDPDLDTRLSCRVRIETSKEGKLYIIDPYRCDTNDPAAIWIDVCEKYGFINPGPVHLQVSGAPGTGEIRYVYKVATALAKVTFPSYRPRTFQIYVDEEEWNTGEILSLSTWDRDRVWAQLSDIRSLPHPSQFLFKTKESKEIPGKVLPPGGIIAARIKFPITWRIETLPNTIIQDNLTAADTVQDAWAKLRTTIPGLFEDAIFNFSGNVRPNLTITAEVFREMIRTTISFEVVDKGWICYPDNDIPNMLDRREICDHYAAEDPRIPPLDQYIEEDTRPYHSGEPINFKLALGIPIDDRSDVGPGRLGGDNGRKIMLPKILYGAPPPIDIASSQDPKVQGSPKGTP
jgi:hypothetical protein